MTLLSYWKTSRKGNSSVMTAKFVRHWHVKAWHSDGRSYISNEDNPIVLCQLVQEEGGHPDFFIAEMKQDDAFFMWARTPCELCNLARTAIRNQRR